jgi:hypothetical protein
MSIKDEKSKCEDAKNTGQAECKDSDVPVICDKFDYFELNDMNDTVRLNVSCEPEAKLVMFIANNIESKAGPQKVSDDKGLFPDDRLQPYRFSAAHCPIRGIGLLAAKRQSQFMAKGLAIISAAEGRAASESLPENKIQSHDNSMRSITLRSENGEFKEKWSCDQFSGIVSRFELAYVCNPPSEHNFAEFESNISRLSSLTCEVADAAGKIIHSAYFNVAKFGEALALMKCQINN